MRLLVFTVVGLIAVIVAYAFSLGGTVGALIFLFIIFNGDPRPLGEADARLAPRLTAPSSRAYPPADRAWYGRRRRVSWPRAIRCAHRRR